MTAAGWALAGSQSSSRHAVAARVQSRTRYAASFVSIYARDLMARERAVARTWFAGPRVSHADLMRVSSALGLHDAAVLDGAGQAGVGGAGRAGSLGPGRASIALATRRGVPVVSFAVAYATASGPRVFEGAYPVPATVLPTVLSHVLAMGGWQAELIDPHGTRLSAGHATGAPASQVRFSAGVAGTSWRIVVHEPVNRLYGFLDGAGRWLAWLALGGLTVAGLAIIVLIARLARRRAELTVLNGELARLAAVDPLTGLRNRRAIEEYLHDALSAARRHKLPLSLLVIDVDRFKSVNDTLGHRTGDAVLAHTARVLNGARRAEDAIGRWGGEEFLVVLPGTDEQGARHATERLRSALAADQPEPARTHGLSVTVTIGVAEWHGEGADELVSRADEALYVGKRAGRDTVEVSPGTVEVSAGTVEVSAGTVEPAGTA